MARLHGVAMAGTLPWSSASPMPPPNDPNEWLRRIDQNTTSMLAWVKYGFIVVIVLLVLVLVGF